MKPCRIERVGHRGLEEKFKCLEHPCEWELPWSGRQRRESERGIPYPSTCPLAIAIQMGAAPKGEEPKPGYFVCRCMRCGESIRANMQVKDIYQALVRSMDDRDSRPRHVGPTYTEPHECADGGMGLIEVVGAEPIAEPA